MSERLLLDTCAIVWIALDQPMKPEALSAIASAAAGNERLRVSPISAWELGLLCSKGRLTTAKPPMTIFNDVVLTDGVRLEALSPELLIVSWFLPGEIHRDPADRILIATARMFALKLVTRDRIILDYAEEGHVKALQC